MTQAPWDAPCQGSVLRANLPEPVVQERTKMKYVRRFFRWIGKGFHRLAAFLFMTFWTDCPRCHEKFGGHQKFSRNVAEKRPDHPRKRDKYYAFVCPSCAKDPKCEAGEAVTDWVILLAFLATGLFFIKESLN